MDPKCLHFKAISNIRSTSDTFSICKNYISIVKSFYNLLIPIENMFNFLYVPTSDAVSY